jgi:hypothetical protein
VLADPKDASTADDARQKEDGDQDIVGVLSPLVVPAKALLAEKKDNQQVVT